MHIVFLLFSPDFRRSSTSHRRQHGRDTSTAQTPTNTGQHGQDTSTVITRLLFTSTITTNTNRNHYVTLPKTWHEVVIQNVNPTGLLRAKKKNTASAPAQVPKQTRGTAQRNQIASTSHHQPTKFPLSSQPPLHPCNMMNDVKNTNKNIWITLVFDWRL